jgi:rhomboid family GlyGly-CTERM serine protease
MKAMESSITGTLDARGRRRQAMLAVILAAALSAVLFAVPGAAEALQYDRRQAGAGGEFWRLLTCHWTHWSLDHLLWNTATFAVLGLCCAARKGSASLSCLGISAVAIPLALHLGCPQLATYRGLSGLDSALFVLLALHLLDEGRRERDGVRALTACAALGLYLAKTAFEYWSGAALFVSDAGGMAPVPLAHAVGAAAGVITWWGARLRPLGAPQGASPLDGP